MSVQAVSARIVSARKDGVITEHEARQIVQAAKRNISAGELALVRGVHNDIKANKVASQGYAKEVLNGAMNQKPPSSGDIIKTTVMAPLFVPAFFFAVSIGALWQDKPKPVLSFFAAIAALLTALPALVVTAAALPLTLAMGGGRALHAKLRD